jgi:probable phosphoglycerate mutase
MTTDATTLMLLRHAAHDAVNRQLCGRAPGICLSEPGRQQARRLAERLAQEPLRAIHSSPLERARETAGIIAQRIGLLPVIDDDLTEIDFGDWAGRSFVELRDDPLWARWNMARGATRAPSGETMREVQRRAIAALGRICDVHPGGRVAVVSHGDVIKAALMHWLAMPLDAYARFEILPASISTVVLWPGGGKVQAMNEVTA